MSLNLQVRLQFFFFKFSARCCEWRGAYRGNGGNIRSVGSWAQRAWGASMQSSCSGGAETNVFKLLFNCGCPEQKDNSLEIRGCIPLSFKWGLQSDWAGDTFTLKISLATHTRQEKACYFLSDEVKAEARGSSLSQRTWFNWFALTRKGCWDDRCSWKHQR